MALFITAMHLYQRGPKIRRVQRYNHLGIKQLEEHSFPFANLEWGFPFPVPSSSLPDAVGRNDRRKAEDTYFSLLSVIVGGFKDISGREICSQKQIKMISFLRL